MDRATQYAAAYRFDHPTALEYWVPRFRGGRQWSLLKRRVPKKQKAGVTAGFRQ
jgi:hypothetical protein